MIMTRNPSKVVYELLVGVQNGKCVRNGFQNLLRKRNLTAAILLILIQECGQSNATLRIFLCSLGM